MRTPPVLLALQESVNEAEADQDTEMAAGTTNGSQQPHNPEPEGLPPIIFGKQVDQAVSVNGSLDNSTETRIMDSNTEAFVPVTEDSTGLVTFTLWLCRRHRSRSKIYLSHEAVKPRAFFTKPMNPALLPDESIRDPQYVLEFQRPRAPVMLGNDQKNIIFKSEKSEDLDLGLENDGFTDIPLEDLKTEGYKKKKRHSQDPPRYSSKAKIESDTDSGIRVWSSTGSLYTASPQLTHCSVPPPPYSPSIGEEPVCLSVHSLPSLSKKLGLIDL